MILETERLSLRPLTAPDAELLFPLLSDPEVMAHWDIAEVDDPDLVRVIVEGQVAAADAGKAVHWTLTAMALLLLAFFGSRFVIELVLGRG